MEVGDWAGGADGGWEGKEVMLPRKREIAVVDLDRYCPEIWQDCCWIMNTNVSSQTILVHLGQNYLDRACIGKGWQG